MTSSSTPPALRVAGLCKRYASVSAVEDVSLEVRHGEIVGLLGPNGAGKTTTLNMILGVLEPSGGTIEIEGLPLARARAQALAHVNFAAVYASLPGNLTVTQNLRVFGLVYGLRDVDARVAELIAQFSLERLAHTRAGLLSSGEQTRLALAKALLNRPRLLLLDEPTASLDPAAAVHIRERIRKLADAGDSGILWTSHNMYEVEAVCDRVLLLSHGRIVLTGDPKRLPAEHGVRDMEELFIRFARGQEQAS